MGTLDDEDNLEPLIDFDNPHRDLKSGKYSGGKRGFWYKLRNCSCLGKTAYEKSLCGSAVCIMILLLLSVIVPLVLIVLKNKGIADEIVIDSFTARNFDIWQSNYYGPGDKREVMCNIHLFSIQNPIQALQGEKPIMLEQGPYAFHQYFNKFDIEFQDDGNIVQYRLQNFYIFDESRSGPGLSLDDKVVLPYPSALGFQYILDNIPISTEELLDAAVEGAINEKLDDIKHTLQVREDAIKENPFMSDEAKNSSLAYIDELILLVEIIESGVDDYMDDNSAGSSLLKLILCTALPNSTGVSMFWEVGPVDAYFGFLNDPLKMQVQKLIDALNLTSEVPWDTSVPGSMTNYTSEADAARRRGIIREYTGKKDLKQIGQILVWNNQTTQYVCVAPMDSQLDADYVDGEEFPWCDAFQTDWSEEVAYEKGYVLVYRSDYANRIHGTDGSTFGAPVDSEKIATYVNDVYRSSYVIYDGTTDDWHGVTLRKYVVNMKDSENATSNPENAQYYNFAPNGLGNLTQVATLPLFISKPHFLDADPWYVSSLIGMQPNREIHDTHLELEPNTGALFRVRNRCQTNYQLNSYHLPKVGEETLRAVEGLCAALNNDTQSNGTCDGLDTLMQCLAVPSDWKVYNDQVYVPYAWMDQDSTGSEDDANSIKDGIYFIDDLCFYFPIACYTLAGMLAVYMLGLMHGRRMLVTSGSGNQAAKRIQHAPIVYEDTSRHGRDSMSDSTSESQFF